jgi:hypothetical protein
MGLFAAVVGSLGGLSAIAGILNAVDVIPNDIGFAVIDWTFWFMLAGVLLLASIALSISRRDTGE